jgi:alpha-tubulin suppressor-like RCC1 family protein
LGDGNDVSDTVPVAVLGGLKFVTLAVGYDHSCGLVAGGTANCWGSNFSGQLGNGSTSRTPTRIPYRSPGGCRSRVSGDERACLAWQLDATRSLMVRPVASIESKRKEVDGVACPSGGVRRGKSSVLSVGAAGRRLNAIRWTAS